MKLTCPKCRAGSTVPDERVPSAGAWARCPKCGERFFIQPLGQGGWLAPPSAPAPAPKARRRSPEAQKLIDRLRSKTEAEGRVTLDGPAHDPAIITVFPQPDASPAPTVIAALVLVGLVAFALVAAFNKGGEAAVTAAAPTRVLSAPPYGEKELRDDLTVLRRLTFRTPHSRRLVRYSGPESRVFKHFLAEMAPDECQEITSLNLKAERAGNVLTAAAVCLDDRRSIPEMKVDWAGRDAVISFAGRPESRRFNLFPPSEPREAPAGH